MPARLAWAAFWGRFRRRNRCCMLGNPNLPRNWAWEANPKVSMPQAIPALANDVKST